MHPPPTTTNGSHTHTTESCVWDVSNVVYKWALRAQVHEADEKWYVKKKSISMNGHGFRYAILWPTYTNPSLSNWTNQKYSQTLISYDITTGTNYLNTGSNAKEMKERSGFSKFIQWVLPFIYHFHRINSNIARSVSVERTFLLAYPKRQCQTCNSHFASDCSTTKWRDYWPRPSEESGGFIRLHGSG